MKRHTILFFCLICTGFSCTKTVTEKQVRFDGKVDLASLLRVNFNFSLFSHALQKTGLDTALTTAVPHTIFLPDNFAFAAVGVTSNEDLDKMAPDSLRRWVSMHILPIGVPSTDIPRAINRSYFTIDGQELHVTHNSTMVRVNGKVVVTADIEASNGYIHVLAKPLAIPWPTVRSFLTGTPNYSIFTAGLKKFGLLDQLDSTGPYTILAPTDDVFEAEGISIDSIGRMDPGMYKPFLFSVSIIHTRMYAQDMGDPEFLPPFINFGSGGLPQSNLTITTPDYVLAMWGADPTFAAFYVFDPRRSGLNPDWVDDGYGAAFLGPNANYGTGISGYGPYTRAAEADHDCLNGIVHGMEDILVWPDSARIH